MYEPGMPPVIPEYDNSMRQACIELADKWIEWNLDTPCPFHKSDIDKLNPGQVIVFLTELQHRKSNFPMKKLTAMDETYAFSSVKNAEIK